MKTKNVFFFAVLIGLLAVAFASGAAYAVSISVDGVRESAWDGVCHIPGMVSDPQEAGIGVDNMKSFQWTNDADNMYFLTETYSNVVMTGFPAPFEYICLDIDNDPSTGESVQQCSMTGVDRTIVVKRTGPAVYAGAPRQANLITTADKASSWSTAFLETRVDRASLGLSDPYACNQSIRAAVYFDNGVSDADDALPDSGTIVIGCGAPTE